ncbi:MAG: anti-sigma factor antagonist [Phycisphaerales bacterium]|nr:MAG: anti-sigma factor antagonist [Phycisphaerales bacterium]
MNERDSIEVSTEQRGDALIVTPTGDIDLHRSPAFRARLKDFASSKPKRLVVDLSRVPYMDSSGVATLVEAMQIARRQSTELVLCGLQDKVRSIFEIARLDMVFKIVPDADTASKA